MSALRRLALAGLIVSALGFQSPQAGEKIPQNIQIKKNPVTLSGTVLSKAKDNFADNCLPCHGTEGKGDGPLAASLNTRPKDLTSAKEITDMTDGEIFWTITKGRKPMPAFDLKLTDEERWGLVHLVRGISHTKPNVTPKAVSSAQAKPPARGGDAPLGSAASTARKK